MKLLKEQKRRKKQVQKYLRCYRAYVKRPESESPFSTEYLESYSVAVNPNRLLIFVHVKDHGEFTVLRRHWALILPTPQFRNTAITFCDLTANKNWQQDDLVTIVDGQS